MEKIQRQYRIRGGLYGLLVGDALGVPYEFHSADEIPPYHEIEMTPPEGFSRAHQGILPGTWSDDGAQALCLLDSLSVCGRFCLGDFSDRLLAWYEEGKWAVDGEVFDVGIQTGEALTAYRSGLAPEKCGILRPDGKGNGALMRVLPLALWHAAQGAADPERRNRELVRDAHSQCLITHGHKCNQVCSALYSLVALELLKGADTREAIQEGVRALRRIYREEPEFEQELEWSIRPDFPWEGSGTGYVVDCLRSAFMILLRAKNYEEVVKQSVMLGDDTDTTACVAGGLAGIIFGEEGIPKRWIKMLLGKDDVEELLAKTKIMFESV